MAFLQAAEKGMHGGDLITTKKIVSQENELFFFSLVRG